MRLLRLTTVIITLFAATLLSGCAISQPSITEEETLPEAVITENGSRVFGEVGETAAQYTGEIQIEGLGTFSFDPFEVKTVREDIFREGYFSLFDVLVHLEESGEIVLDYYFDHEMNTYVISSLNGHGNWWYNAFYDGGWPERSVFRMDHYPYKDKMTLNVVPVTEDYLYSVYDTYRDEVNRFRANDGKVIVPEVIIEGRNERFVFENVEVKAHDLRPEMFQPGVVTAIDTIISLGDAGLITYDLQWYESIGTADVVKSYWVNRINEDESRGRCGFVYEAGDEQFYFFRGNHNHIPSDTRVINSPQYVKYFWICI